nr:transforming growth factor beta receptor type 3-like isoform X1 [Nerophis lumbriciformis]
MLSLLPVCVKLSLDPDSCSCFLVSGLLFPAMCQLEPAGEGHPVQAALKTFTVLSGCASRGTAGLPQEVHVINLRGAAPDHAPVQVELHLKPIQSLSRHRKPLVFVLNSPGPLVWKIKTENLAPGVQRTFHVSQGSEVRFPPGNFSRSCQVHQELLPHGNQHLLTWTLKTYQALTSFSEIRMTRDVYVKVGEDPMFSDTCKIDSRFLSLNYLGGYVQPQPSKGCVVSADHQDQDQDQDQEVHIIELQAPNSSSAFQVDVVVELRPQEDDAPLHRDVVLLLKCTKSVNWVIKSHNVVGKLSVVASDSISVSPGTERRMQVSKTPKQQLPPGPRALITWLHQHNYGATTSYTSTPLANHFDVRLLEAHRHPDAALPPELAILRQSGPASGGALRRSGPPFPFPPPESEGLPLPSLLDDRPWEAPSVSLAVQCEDAKMVVSISKESLEVNGFANANLTLQDPQCKAEVNTTHYTLETPLTGCQTTVYPLQGTTSALYINTVLISHAESKDGSGGPLESEDLESTEVFPREAVDLDRRAGPDQLSIITFNCTYQQTRDRQDPGPGPGPGPVPGSVRPVDMTFSMDLYHTPLTRQTSRQAFFTVSQDQEVFVEVRSSSSDPGVGFTIVSCMVSPDADPKGASSYTLIETVCPTDDSLHFTTGEQQVDRKLFSFTFRSEVKVSPQFLHCKMSPCSMAPSAGLRLRLAPCLGPRQPCNSLDLDHILTMMMDAKTTSTALKLMDASSHPPHVTDLPTYPDPDPEVPDDPANKNTMDTPTVVIIAFAAFAIGALLTGALWFIYSHTGGGAAAVGGTQKCQPASEHSSGGHSVGSTRSTPCSSSSTA